MQCAVSLSHIRSDVCLQLIPNSAVMSQRPTALIVLLTESMTDDPQNGWSSTTTMSEVKYCDVTTFFGIFLDTDKLQNLMKFRLTVEESYSAHVI